VPRKPARALRFRDAKIARRAQPEKAELVAVQVAEIGAVKGIGTFLDPEAGLPFVRSAKLERPGMKRIHLRPLANGDRHRAVAGARLLSVIGPNQRQAGLPGTLAVEREPSRKLH
jgi:hypothetical protein